MFAYFISADWSKNPEKRSVYVTDIDKRLIFKPSKTGFWNLEALLKLANSLRQSGNVLIGVDIVIGVSNGYWQMILEKSGQNQPENFIHWLRNIEPDSTFFSKTINNSSKWKVDEPWFDVPKGKGGLTSFKEKVNDGFLRRIDQETGAKPVFAVSGIPGVVGAATRSFWHELIPFLNRCGREFTIFPFEHDLSNLFYQDAIVLCEIYPSIAYAAALADKLPEGRLRISKTNQQQREEACECLKKNNWVKRNQIDLGDLDPLIKSEDDFDAHLTAAAVMRCVIERRPLASQDWIDGIAEGSMLLTGAFDPALKAQSLTTLSQNKRSPISSSIHDAGHPNDGLSTPSLGRAYRCPIPGCQKIFIGSRSGWDAHIASFRMHPDWQPKTKDSEKRRRLFRTEFQEWFQS